MKTVYLQMFPRTSTLERRVEIFFEKFCDNLFVSSLIFYTWLVSMKFESFLEFSET